MGTRKRTGKGSDKKNASSPIKANADSSHQPVEGSSDVDNDDTSNDAPRSPRTRARSSLRWLLGALLLMVAGLAVTLYFVPPPSRTPDTAGTGPAEPVKSSHPGSNTVQDDKDSETVPGAPKPAPVDTDTRKHEYNNKADNRIRTELNNAEDLVTKKSTSDAVKAVDAILARYPSSPRAAYIRAKALCQQAEEQMSNTLLEQCIEQYGKILALSHVPKSLMLRAGRECAERQQFRGWSQKAVKVLTRLVEMYPEETKLWNEIGVQNLMSNKVNDARAAFKKVLAEDPDNPYALVHLGFIIKTTDNDQAGAIPYLRSGLQGGDTRGDTRVRDGRFFFHLGDALQRVGNVSEAHEWYEKGAALKLFRSKWQRSLYNVDHLQSQPWWTTQQTRQNKLWKTLEENWQTIRDEGLANMDGTKGFKPEEENLRERGDWRQLTLYQQGHRIEASCKLAPKTCKLFEQFPDATGCKRGQIKFSVMQPGVHVWPHCGPTNCRIRGHLGLVVPDGVKIRVVDDIRTWQEGKMIIFDDSFEHEVWHDGESFRMVLIVDVWHPDLSKQEKQRLTPI